VRRWKSEAEKFYLHRRERNGCMGTHSRTGNRKSPELGWTSVFIAFYLPVGGMFQCKELGDDQMSLGKEMGYFFP
jgi:hypothetical protein